MQNGLGQPLDFGLLGSRKDNSMCKIVQHDWLKLVVFAKRTCTAAFFELSEAVQCMLKLN